MSAISPNGGEYDVVWSEPDRKYFVSHVNNRASYPGLIAVAWVRGFSEASALAAGMHRIGLPAVWTPGSPAHYYETLIARAP